MAERRVSPALILVSSFALAAVGGGLLLTLPGMTRGAPLAPLDALFTAVSAVCVTGLTVVDTGTRFTFLGQLVILGLVQCGGLGIMTFAVFAVLVLGGQLSFRDRILIRDTLHHSPSSELRRLLRYIVSFTLATEAVGAVLLWLRLRQVFAPGQAVFLSVFHSISAFCNAGFSPFPDSLVRYRGDLAVNLVVTGLIVAGGLGFLVCMELGDKIVAGVTGRRRRLSLQTRLVLVTNAGLLAAGVAGFLALEWTNLLAGLGLGEKLLAAWFQAVTPRTAGFNTLDYGQAGTATLFFTILLMFVGASPGSTGGGIKTTSFALLVLLLRARWQGRGQAWAFGRSIPFPALDRALLLTLLSWALTSGALLLIVLAESGVRPHGAAGPAFLQLMFETVSAFATVGLSTGITPSLSAAGKLVLMMLMFVGRVGPLTVALAAGRSRRRWRFRYAEENVMVG